VARLPELPARRVLAALRRAGFSELRRHGSHRLLAHSDGRTLVFALHDAERVGPKLLAKILKDARMTPDEFRRLA
jgi:predicted RNA binding protein YcfA (HicA-like mRNA interferase family)